MKYKYIGTKEQLREFGYKEWRKIFMIKKIEDDIYVHVSTLGFGHIQRGHHTYYDYIGEDDWICDAWGSPVQENDIQDLIDAGLVEVTE